MILNAAYQKISGNFVKINAGNLWEFCVFKLGGHPVYCPVPVFCFSFHCSLEPLVFKTSNRIPIRRLPATCDYNFDADQLQLTDHHNNSSISSYEVPVGIQGST